VVGRWRSWGGRGGVGGGGAGGMQRRVAEVSWFEAGWVC